MGIGIKYRFKGSSKGDYRIYKKFKGGSVVSTFKLLYETFKYNIFYRKEEKNYR